MSGLFAHFKQAELLKTTPLMQSQRIAIMKEDKSLSFIDDNEIDLSKMQTFEQRSRAMPEIGNGSKLILGDDHDDYFKLTGSEMTGSLDGAGGYDTLDLSEYGSKKLLSVRRNLVILFRGGEAFSLKNIESIVGRRNMSDIVYICNENRIDLAGSFNNPDEIFIAQDEDHKCLPPTNLTIYLRKDTHVSCTCKTAKVTYLVLEDGRGVDHIRMKPLNGRLMAYLDAVESAFEIIEKYSQFIEDSSLMTLVVNSSDGIIVLKHNHHSIQVNVLYLHCIGADELLAGLGFRGSSLMY
uniref:Uncharacterized protein n=1 Tax=Romanomermis culicivorax TaxID=13658 RepID=A0A915JEL7_ROMCU